MTKIKVEGADARIVAAIITKTLRDAGVSLLSFYDITPREVANCRREATRKGVSVSIVAMSR